MDGPSQDELQMLAARRGALKALVLATSLMPLGACGALFPTRYRFRMTVEIDTPEGMRTGSRVYEVIAYNTGSILAEGAKRYWELRGEAVAVDLPDGEMLFALLKPNPKLEWNGLAEVSMKVLDPTFHNDIVESAGRISRREHILERAPVPTNSYPMLVRFRDIHDPRSIELIDPADLAASFGAGVRLRSVVVQVTNDPITKGLTKRLPWLDHLDSYRNDPANPFTNSLPLEIGYLRGPII